VIFYANAVLQHDSGLADRVRFHLPQVSILSQDGAANQSESSF
jgi:hypothetical protein